MCIKKFIEFSNNKFIKINLYKSLLLQIRILLLFIRWKVNERVIKFIFVHVMNFFLTQICEKTIYTHSIIEVRQNDARVSK